MRAKRPPKKPEVVSPTREEHKRQGPVWSLIRRKLRHQAHERERVWTSIRQTAFKNLHEHILTNFRNGRLGRAFVSDPIDTYRELAESAGTITTEWPTTVWETITTLLDHVPDTMPDNNALNAIIDEFAWAITQEPFTLKYVDPEMLTQYVYTEAARYGGLQEYLKADFDRTLQITAAATRAAILNTARQAREGVAIAMEEYILKRQREGHRGHLTVGSEPFGERPVERPGQANASTSSDCLLHPPTRKDDWFNAIRDMVLDFHRDNQRCPNASEAWVRLRGNPPVGYGIKPGTDRGAEAIVMDGRALDKRSFLNRWKRYTQSK